ncbi:MAG: hypothetical protein AAGI07_01590 [Bacteroidota bacterium]
MKRRQFIKHCINSGIALSACPNVLTAASFQSYPVIPITSGEYQHWFGYYDKFQIDPTGRYALGNQVDAFFRPPNTDDILRIGLIDLKKKYKWKEIGQSTSWGWQQGCMLQWIPGSAEEVIWNSRNPEKPTEFMSMIYNIKTKKTRTLPRPFYTLSPDGSFALSVNFARLQDMRPGYGYSVPEGVGDIAKAPADDGIFKMDLKTGDSQLIISLEQLSKLERTQGSVKDNFHWCNHLLVSPSGNRFIFLNRSRPYRVTSEMKKEEDWVRKYVSTKHVTRAITCNTDGSDLYLMNDSGTFSHFIWRRDDAITAWAKPEDNDKANFFRFYDKSKKSELIDTENMPLNGHNTYVPNTNYEWILNDTYPQGPDRLQELYLYHVPTKRKVVLGRFHEPKKFYSEWRCDLHPRCDQEGKRVFFDSTHEGDKRQMYMIDIEKIVQA